MPREVRTNPEVVREVWRRYFPKIALTDTRWYEIHDSVFLAENFKIAAENITGGKHLRALDEENVGKYVMGIIRKRRKGQIVRRTSRGVLLTTEFWFHSEYAITQNDRERFQKRLQNSGACLLYKGNSTTGGYRRFWVNGGSMLAHRFAYFEPLGYLPAPGELGGPNGLQVAHNCRNRSCCNPQHLRLTTKSVNLLERIFEAKPVEAAGKGDYGSSNGSVPSGYTEANPNACPQQCCVDPLADASVAQSGINNALSDVPPSYIPSSPQAVPEHLPKEILSDPAYKMSWGVTGNDEIPI
jgi:HNH endonuclease